ncbi:flavin reductase family protein [Halobacillus naozhouensis]|uniref:Flavin reductase family protein n=1 Tax=Halobacillus naozhouensis TaxID=554880 RepID=A0ABY8IZL4_9BACI|nr:flavin reductase family protein [Halobacillus naozhouensis]WFT75663.1 flavin reductase family protein [Halobacillus naozhouensis]
MRFDPSEHETKNIYKLLSGSVVPRPIAWVSTLSDSGVHNLAPFSFFTVASRQPPMLCISIGPGVGARKGTVKDTLENIRTSKEFVINISSTPLGNEMQKTSENLASEVDEFEEAGLTPISSEKIRPMRVEEAPIHMECKLHQIVELGSDHLLIGEMVLYHIQEDYYMEEYKVNFEKLRPLGRLAASFSESRDFFSLPKEDLK